jgi:hypothetical protein
MSAPLNLEIACKLFVFCNDENEFMRPVVFANGRLPPFFGDMDSAPSAMDTDRARAVGDKAGQAFMDQFSAAVFGHGIVWAVASP